MTKERNDQCAVEAVDPTHYDSDNHKQKSRSAPYKTTGLSFDPMTRLSNIDTNMDIYRSCEIKSITTTSKHTQGDGEILNDTNLKDGTKFTSDFPKYNDHKLSPDEFLHKLVQATCDLCFVQKKALSLENFFATVTDEQVAAYTMVVVSACRKNDLDALKKLYSEEGQIMNCSNRFGESLLTMACRRGFEAIVEYLLQLPDVDVRIRDDSGRTILHDACWNPKPQLNIVRWILERDPALFFISDNRGCTPFQYARSEHWGIWRQFLLENKDSLQALKSEDVIAKFSKDGK